MKRKKILIFSDSPNIASGFGTQGKYIADALAKDHDVFYQGMAYYGLPSKLSNGITMLPNGTNRFGKDMLPYWIKEIQPNILITLLDIWMDGWLLEYQMNGIRWIKMIPLDSPSMLQGWRQCIKAYDTPLAFSEFSKELIQKTCNITPEYIPHCVDTSTYYPLSQEKIDVLKERNGLKDCFVVGMVGRNQLRKMQPRLFEAFAEFAKDKDDVRLLLHMDLIEAEKPPHQFGWDLNTIAEQLGIKDKIIKTIPETGYQFKYNFSEKKMAIAYNQMDVHYLCPNEGFGVPAIEALACGVPNIIGDYTTGKELTANGKCGILVPCDDWHWNVGGAKWGLINKEKLVEALNWSYKNRDSLKKMGEIGRILIEKKYSVKVVSPQWNELIRKVLKSPLPINYQKKQLGI